MVKIKFLSVARDTSIKKYRRRVFFELTLGLFAHRRASLLHNLFGALYDETMRFFMI